MNYKNVKNILFDFGGVIISLNKQAAINRFREIGLANIEDYLGEFRQEGIFLEYEEGKINRVEFLEAFRKLAGKEDVTIEEIDSAWMAFLVGIPDYKYQLLRDLRKKYNVYLLSNTNPSVTNWARTSDFSPEGKPIGDFFEKCYMSYEMGCAKPERKIFDLLIEDSGIKPAETLFLDDGPANIKIAQQLGFQIYLTNQDEDLTKVFDKVNKD